MLQKNFPVPANFDRNNYVVWCWGSCCLPNKTVIKLNDFIENKKIVFESPKVWELKNLTPEEQKNLFDAVNKSGTLKITDSKLTAIPAQLKDLKHINC